MKTEWRRLAYLVDGVLGEESLGLLIADGGVNDNVVTLLPVHRGRDAVLVANLESCNVRQHNSRIGDVWARCTYSR